MNRLKKGDEVIIISGKEKGRIGIITNVLRKKRRILIEGMNLVKRHIKPNPNKGINGGIIDKESSIHESNIALYNKDTQKADYAKIKYSTKYNKNIRYFKSNDKLVQSS